MTASVELRGRPRASPSADTRAAAAGVTPRRARGGERQLHLSPGDEVERGVADDTDAVLRQTNICRDQRGGRRAVSPTAGTQNAQLENGSTAVPAVGVGGGNRQIIASRNLCPFSSTNSDRLGAGGIGMRGKATRGHPSVPPAARGASRAPLARGDHRARNLRLRRRIALPRRAVRRAGAAIGFPSQGRARPHPRGPGRRS